MGAQPAQARGRPPEEGAPQGPGCKDGDSKLAAYSLRHRRTPRTSRRAKLTSVEEVHRRFGVTSERILRSLHHSALGVAPFSTRELTRFVTASSAKASTLRTAIRKEALGTEDSSPEPGVSASVDLTRVFVRSVDGYDCAAVFMDRSTWFIWIGPMKNHTCKEFVRVLGDYRRKVRQLFNVELRTVRADSDPCFTANRVNGGALRNNPELQAYLDQLPTSQHVVFTHSAAYHQALNPVECAARQLYHLMNYYLECGRLSAISWLDMLLAAAYSMNQLPHPQSRDRKKQVQSAFELIHGRKPDLSLMIAGPGEIVIVDEEGAKASGGAATGSHCIFIHPEEGGFMVR